MWPIRPKNSRRRREFGPERPEAGAWTRILDARVALPALILVVFWIAVSQLVIWSSESVHWRRSMHAERDIIARVDFEFPSVKATEQARAQAPQNSPNVYTPNVELTKEIHNDLLQLQDHILSLDEDAFFEQMEENSAITQSLSNNFESFKSALASASSESFGSCINSLENELFKPGREFIKRAPRSPLGGILVFERESIGAESDATVPWDEDLRDPGIVPRIDDDEVQGTRAAIVYKLKEAATTAFASLAAAKSNPTTRPTSQPAKEDPTTDAARNDVIGDVIGAYLIAKIKPGYPDGIPTWKYDDVETMELVDQRVEKVEQQTEKVSKGDLIVRVGEPINEEGVDVILAENKAFLASQSPRDSLLAKTSQFTIVFILIGGLVVHAGLLRVGVLSDPARTLGLCLLLFLALLIVMMLNVFGVKPLTLLPVGTAAAVVAIAYNRQFALGVATVLALLVVQLLSADAAFLTVLLASTAVVIFMLDDIRRRQKLIEVGLAAALVASALTMAFDLSEAFLRGQSIGVELASGSWISAAAGLLIGFSVLGLLPLVERFFGTATSMTLLEWSDTSKPLLQRLAVEVPGTFNHSLQIGNMSDAAAEAIGANGLLCRVGALYHDIGKLTKPQYFIENQQDQFNRHDSLSPAMSLLIILGHVKDGVEMAKEYALPRVLHQFVAEHHGTTVIEYFYRAAQQQSDDGSRIDDTQFRYPGPRPRTKESAIVMLSDSLEGVVRALPDPTTARIRHVVREMTNRRLMDGQFDDCNLTLRELSQVEVSLTKSILGQYHGRIAYPSSSSDQAEEPKPSLNAQQG